MVSALIISYFCQGHILVRTLSWAFPYSRPFSCDVLASEDSAIFLFVIAICIDKNAPCVAMLLGSDEVLQESQNPDWQWNGSEMRKKQ